MTLHKSDNKEEIAEILGFCKDIPIVCEGELSEDYESEIQKEVVFIIKIKMGTRGI